MRHEVVRISPDYRKFSFGFSLEGAEGNLLARRCKEALSQSAVTVANLTEETKRIFASALMEAEERTNLAKEARKKTDLSPERIAETLGYSNEYNLNRAFRKSEGMSPGAFRRSAGKK